MPEGREASRSPHSDGMNERDQLRALVKQNTYYRAVIKDAAYRLRGENVAHMVATDLEDSLRWSTDPEQCQHPYGNCRTDGTTVCRSCGTDTTRMEGMGT